MATKEQKIIFKKIDGILYSYNECQKKIKKNLEFLENPKLIKSFRLNGEVKIYNKEVKSDFEKIEELKARFISENKKYEDFLFQIDSILEMLDDEKAYEFIKLRYINKLTMEEIAERFETCVQTVYRTKKKVFSKLELYFKVQGLI